MGEEPLSAPRPALVFDYGGVLCHHQPAADWRRLEELVGVAGRRFHEVYWELRVPYDRGDLDGPAYWRELARVLGRDLSAETRRELVRVDVGSWLHLDPVMISWLERLQAGGWPTAILSNMGIELRRRVAALPWVARCDHRTFSCEVGAVKPEPAIYRHCLAGLGCGPTDAVLIDDRPANLATAAELGLGALRFEEASSFARRIAERGDLPAVA